MMFSLLLMITLPNNLPRKREREKERKREREKERKREREKERKRKREIFQSVFTYCFS